MTIRRLLVAALVALGALLTVAPVAHANGHLACAWVDPNGVCVSNPLGDLPRTPPLP
ncbi:MAG: hypothetical protein QOI47_502 [Actinomycetota bacterium]|jgi:hypothetical protein|nr:hypothetical protein [Actinomycetota bacterium]